MPHHRSSGAMPLATRGQDGTHGIRRHGEHTHRLDGRLQDGCRDRSCCGLRCQVLEQLGSNEFRVRRGYGTVQAIPGHPVDLHDFPCGSRGARPAACPVSRAARSAAVNADDGLVMAVASAGAHRNTLDRNLRCRFSHTSRPSSMRDRRPNSLPHKVTEPGMSACSTFSTTHGALRAAKRSNVASSSTRFPWPH